MPKGTGVTGKTPGSELKKLIEQYKLSVRATAIELGENPISLKAVIDNKKKINAELACKLAKVFSSTPQQWIGLQTDYDLAEAKGKASLQKKIAGMKKAEQIESGRAPRGSAKKPAGAKKPLAAKKAKAVDAKKAGAAKKPAGKRAGKKAGPLA
ncbi:MAG: HigA family addiction module antidote protein [Spirochaetaceae bacterium]|jgi:addiction module HigA family antidote|nr:HigA family addiction module antidote protein [Spirochaetaceae bacterium]